MYNASKTIDATLSSVIAQSYRNLDIIVVDDGSTDDSALKVRTWMERDKRLRLITQSNSGVAAARNRGAAEATADYLAFIDSDDLWSPNNIEAQISCMLGSSNSVGLVYSWYAHIDRDGRVLSLRHRPTSEGSVLRQMLTTNFVGSGSSALFRRAAFNQVGGFDTNPLIDGCEDLTICLRMAERFEFRVVKRYLVGYRILPDSKSSNPMKMRRACETALAAYRQRYPEFSREMQFHLDERSFWLLVRAASQGFYGACYELIRLLWKSDPSFVLCHAPAFVGLVARARAPRFLKRLAQRLVPSRTGRGLQYLELNW